DQPRRVSRAEPLDAEDREGHERVAAAPLVQHEGNENRSRRREHRDRARAAPPWACARPAPSEQAPNTISPATSTRRRPSRSASLPRGNLAPRSPPDDLVRHLQLYQALLGLH